MLNICDIRNKQSLTQQLAGLRVKVVLIALFWYVTLDKRGRSNDILVSFIIK
jgi:hypothetical protein